VIELRFLERETAARVAELLGLSAKSVWQRQRRALARLRRILKHHHDKE
jgi:DNA-directed RNA polymerase specialized sigma24 family protein